MSNAGRKGKYCVSYQYQVYNYSQVKVYRHVGSPGSGNNYSKDPKNVLEIRSDYGSGTKARH